MNAHSNVEGNSNRQIRIFISSTFRTMQAERNDPVRAIFHGPDSLSGTTASTDIVLHH